MGTATVVGICTFSQYSSTFSASCAGVRAGTTARTSNFSTYIPFGTFVQALAHSVLSVILFG